MRLHTLLVLFLPLLLAGCFKLGDRREPIPYEAFPGRGEADRKTLVIVLPGRADNVEVMREFGVPQAIQAGWPEVDVWLTSATLAYYTDGGLPERVSERFIEPARAQGYQRLILMGASMGGMGSLVVDEAHPGVFEHVVLMAPYLGRRRVMREVEAAGGIRRWQPGPKPEVVDRGNFDRELLWRQIANYAADPALRQRVWLAYGEEDRLASTVPLVAPALEDAQILPQPGGHKWVVWNAAATEIFTRLRTRATQVARKEPLGLR
ncbi:MAG: alpha/beta hydrolase-fold protein [Lysobacterales bacterium]